MSVLTIDETVALEAEAAHHKVELARRPGLFAVRTALAGAYIGIGVVIMLTAGGPLKMAGSPWAPLVQGLVFGLALTIVVVAGGELATSAMMILTQGVVRRSVRAAQAGVVLLAVLAGNLVGSAIFAGLVHASGIMASGTAPGDALAALVAHKAEISSGQLFFRGVLCNLLVCLAIWCAARLTSEGAKIAVIFACVMVFITSGFEHVVANMTTFSLGLFAGLPHATIAEFGRNVLWVGLGNLVGGALLVGVAYAYGAGPKLPRSDEAHVGDATSPDEAHTPAVVELEHAAATRA